MNPFNLPNINNQFEDVTDKYSLNHHSESSRKLLTLFQITKNSAADQFDSIFTFSLKHSKFAEASLMKHDNLDSASTLPGLISNISSIDTDLVYIGSSNVFVSENFFGYCVDVILSNNNIQAVSVNSFTNNVLSEDPTGSVNITNSINAYESLTRFLGVEQDLSVILSHFVFRKEVVISLLQSLYDNHMFKPQQALDLILNSSIQIHNIPDNLISIFAESSIDELVEKGVQLFNQEEVEQAIPLFNKAAAIDPNYPNIHYLQAAAKATTGNWWEAKIDLSKELTNSKKENNISDLEIVLNELLPHPQPTFKQIENSIDTVFGQLVPGQEEFLFNKARELPDDSVILEIGSFYGRSTVSMAFGALGSNKRIFSIDTFCWNEGVIGGSNDWRNTFEYNLKRFGLDHLVTILQGYSYEHLSNWNDLPLVDMVFIDASHWYTDVINDLALVYPIVKPGGWIVLHDTNPSWTGPWRVWREAGMKITSNHQYCSSISCGQKIAGGSFPPISDVEGRSVFSYSNELLKYWKELKAELNPYISHFEILISPDSPSKQIELAESAILNLPDSEIKTLENMAKKEGRVDGDLHYWLGLIYQAKNNTNLAIESLKKAVSAEIPPQTNRAREILGLLSHQAIANGVLNSKESLPTKQVNLKSSSKDCIEPLQKAKRYINSNRIHEALDLLDRAIQQQNSFSDLLQLKALCLSKLGDANTAQNIERAVKLLFNETPNAEKEATTIVELNSTIKPTPSTQSNHSSKDPEFLQILNSVRPYSLLPEERLYSLFNFAKEICIGDLPGNIVECGITGGGASALLAYVIRIHSRRPRLVFAFDSYNNTPDFIKLKSNDTSNPCTTPLDSINEISRILCVEHIVVPIQGEFESTLQTMQKDIGKISLLHANCDHYPSKKAIFKYLLQQVSLQGVVQVNDSENWHNIEKTFNDLEREHNLHFNIAKISEIDENSAWFQKT